MSGKPIKRRIIERGFSTKCPSSFRRANWILPSPPSLLVLGDPYPIISPPRSRNCQFGSLNSLLLAEKGGNSVGRSSTRKPFWSGLARVLWGGDEGGLWEPGDVERAAAEDWAVGFRWGFHRGDALRLRLLQLHRFLVLIAELFLISS